eukprot:CAMPEP_0196592206 /NCGR_PEP_ID=MMETSP1081-20130531/72041_1 /TAXON_ID=36882 /ORGANISM="Pyramimonas amylifera, Strain CCMP720" /LENGTH=156 /DNA_ID=CAMNT_0041915817 /DNA_START=76 /DNA_END=543 /DNA_ORIENTATION=+
MLRVPMSTSPARLSSRHSTSGNNLRLAKTCLPAVVAVRAPVVQTKALFGFGKAKTDGPMICIDCGYIVQSGFNELPRNYKCPACNVGKNRFKAYEQAGNSYSSMAAQKAANKAAFRAKRASGKDTTAGPSKRELAKQKLIDAQDDQDNKKKGFFGW